MMMAIRSGLAVLLLVFLLSACAPTSPETRGRVHCPACHIELDALFEKRY